MEDIALDADALGQLQAQQKELLDTIDDLRKHGIDRFVDLPQIVVVGDQSSGKSSVLEAISRVRFPVRDGLCTRFATELVLRADSRTRVEVTIEPSPSSNREVQPFNETRFNSDELPRLIEDAKRKMLVDGSGFSEDVLRVEIRGPNLTQLTLVDLPGFYHSEDENQSAAGRQLVDRLAARYMSRDNTIILAIVSARNQVILQAVLSKVKEHDKNTERTLGIITKPDLLAPGSQDEENFVRLAKNLDRSHKLTLGWHVLRNRTEGEQDCTHEQRDDAEREFFMSAPWSSLPSRNRGVNTLRAKLSKTLLQHIKNNLPALVHGIEDNLNDRQRRLRHLGEPRSDPDQLRLYLDHIASQFQRLSRDAVEGNYGDEFFGGLYPETGGIHTSHTRIRKLRGLIRDLNRIFAYILATKGSSSIILPREPHEPHEGNDNVSDTPALPQYLQGLVDQYKFDEPPTVSFESIAVDLERLSSENQGNEFPGTSNDRVAIQLFQHQSKPWEKIAHSHLKLVLDTAKAFVEALMEHIIGPDTQTFAAILREFVHPFFDQKVSELENKLVELLHHYKSGYPQPLDAEFRSLLSSRRRKNLTEEALRDLLATRPEVFTDAGREELRKKQNISHSNGFGVEELIDKSETYYEMSLRTFTDNVIVLAIENCLIRDLPNVFTTRAVNRMEPTKLEQLASESPDIQQERTELQGEIDALTKGSRDGVQTDMAAAVSILSAMDNLSLATPPVRDGADGNTLSAPGVSRTPSTSGTTSGDRGKRESHASGSSSTTPKISSGSLSNPGAVQARTPNTGGGLFNSPAPDKKGNSQRSDANVPFSVAEPPGPDTGLFSGLGSTSKKGDSSGATPSSPTPGLFGKPSSSEATPSSSTLGLFGKPSSSSSSSPLSNSSGAIPSSSTSGLLGKPSSPGAFPSSSTSGLFGKPSSSGATPSSSTPGLFGKPSPFGSSSPLSNSSTAQQSSPFGTGNTSAQYNGNDRPSATCEPSSSPRK
ncbi:hypothetical protein DL765_002494 [Monosporascus sp. GIB2]|nr:hypothetical protein DL765_002494 [Monosporascus sp. GIB2]